MLVCCVNCRSKNTKKEKKGKIAQDAEDTDSKLDITLKDILFDDENQGVPIFD